MNSGRSQSIAPAAWSGILGNLALAVLKGAAGYISNSKALMGDALYTAAETVSQLLERLFSSEASTQGTFTRIQDREKVRSFISVIFAILVLMSGLQLAISAVRSLSASEPQAPGLYALVTACAALMIREALFQFRYRYSLKQGNPQQAYALATHERYSLYASLAALLGIICAMAGAVLDWHVLLYMDPAAALLVACFVLRKGYLIIMQAMYQTQVQQMNGEDYHLFMETVQRVQGVVTIEHMHAQECGHFVKVHGIISVNPRITVQEAQEIADRAKTLLLTRFPQVAEVQIQFVPYQAGYPYKSNHELPDNDVSTLLQ